MKKILLILSTFFILHFVQAQTPYADAIELSKYVQGNTFKSDPASVDAVIAILKNYMAGLSPNATAAAVRNSFTDSTLQNYNPILEPFLQFAGPLGTSRPSPAGGNPVASLLNAPVTNLADGLAKFLLQRAKEELNVAFFRKFQEFLQQYPEAATLFPATAGFIGNIVSYKYAAMLPALRTAFQNDLNALVTDLKKLRYLSPSDCHKDSLKCAARLTNLQQLVQKKEINSLFIILTFADNITKGNNAADALNAAATDPDIIYGNNSSEIIRFVNLLSQSIRSQQPGEIWASRNDLQPLLTNDVTLKLYMGLLYAKDKLLPTPITFNNKALSLQQLLFNASINVTAFKDAFTSLSTVADNFSNSTADLSRANDDQDKLLAYAGYFSTVSSMLKAGAALLNVDNSLKRDITEFSTAVDNGVNICSDIKLKSYTSLAVHSSLFLKQLLGSQYTYEAKYTQYATFIASIVEAKSSDEVQAAIEAAVLPVGSSSIKRETEFNVSLNAFIGPYGGVEYLPALKEKKWSATAGLTAPVGIAFSWGQKGKGKTGFRKNGKEIGGKSISIFVPLIDVGSFASFRLSNDSSNVASEVQLKNIISPGLYVYLGLGKCPISIGLGGQVGPQLREINAKVANTDQNFYIRFGLNVVVDIPFFNLYTR